MADPAERSRQLAQARERADQAKREIEQLELQTAEAKAEERQRQKDQQRWLAEIERLSKEESTLVAKRIQLDEAILKIVEQKESLQEQLQGKMLSEAGISRGMAGLVAPPVAPSASPPKKGSDFDCFDSMDLFKDIPNASQSVAPVQSQGLPDLIGLDAALSQPAAPPQQAGLLATGFLTAAPAAAVSQMAAFGGMESGASTATSANFLNGSPCAAPGATGGAWGGSPVAGPAFTGGYAGSAPAQGMPFPQQFQQQFQQQQFQQQFQQPQQGQPPPPQPQQFPASGYGNTLQQQFQQPQQGQPPPPPPQQQQQQGTADDFSRLLMAPLGR